MDQFDRVFLLHRLLSSRQHTGASLDELLALLDDKNPERMRQTLKRTLRYMRDALQVPLIHDRERGVYRYDSDGIYELPGLWFTAQELTALLVLDEVIEQQPIGLLSEALRPARAKIERILERTAVGIPHWRSRLRLLRMAARSPGTQFSVVADALAQRRRVRIDYHTRSDDRMAPRVVSPQRLTQYRDNWYLDAWCHARNDLRTFALDRIIAAEALDQRADDVASEQLNDVLATSYGIFSGKPTATAVLRFSAHAARWVAAETWHPQQQDMREEDGRLTRHLPYHHSEELVMDILRHGPDVEVIEPDVLRTEVSARLQRALVQYAPAAPDDVTENLLNNTRQHPDSTKQHRAVSTSSVHEPDAAYARPRNSPAKSRR